MKVTYLEILEMIKDNINPNTVKWNGKIYKWDLDNVNYAIYHKDSAEFLYDKQAMSVQATRKDIEIIEEEKKIELPEELKEILIPSSLSDSDDFRFIFNYINDLIKNQKQIVDYLKYKEEESKK